ncbi:hypothetical protein AAKU55_000680 [Oxalobacteraceae bacterium GrIS 1.11]
MLPNTFVDWWFAPWTVTPALPQPSDRLGQRDAYRLCCAQSHIAPDLPAKLDPAWHVAYTGDVQELLATARLFAGLIAARQHDASALAALAPAERDWCLRTASTQPLLACNASPYGAADALDIRGLTELACHLEQAFPGLWPRLRLALGKRLRERIDQLLPSVGGANGAPGAIRAQRCWLMCRRRCASPARAKATLAPMRGQSRDFPHRQ